MKTNNLKQEFDETQESPSAAEMVRRMKESSKLLPTLVANIIYEEYDHGKPEDLERIREAFHNQPWDDLPEAGDKCVRRTLRGYGYPTIKFERISANVVLCDGDVCVMDGAGWCYMIARNTFRSKDGIVRQLGDKKWANPGIIASILRGAKKLGWNLPDHEA